MTGEMVSQEFIGQSSMRVVLWDTRRNGALKDQPGQSDLVLQQVIQKSRSWKNRFFQKHRKPDVFPISAAFPIIAENLQSLGHEVQYCEDIAPLADVFIFNPSMQTLSIERSMMVQVRRAQPKTQILVVGDIATRFPELFCDQEVVVVAGPVIFLAGWWDDLLRLDPQIVKLLDSETYEYRVPNWDIVDYRSFRVSSEFSNSPTATVDASLFPPDVEKPEAAVCRNMIELGERFGFRSFRISRLEELGFSNSNQPSNHTNEKLEIGTNPVSRFLEMTTFLDEFKSQAIQYSIYTHTLQIESELLHHAKSCGLTTIQLDVRGYCQNGQHEASNHHEHIARTRAFVKGCHAAGIRTKVNFRVEWGRGPREDRQALENCLADAMEAGAMFSSASFGNRLVSDSDSVKNIDTKSRDRESVSRLVSEYNLCNAPHANQFVESSLHSFAKLNLNKPGNRESSSLLIPAFQRIKSKFKVRDSVAPVHPAGLAGDSPKPNLVPAPHLGRNRDNQKAGK